MGDSETAGYNGYLGKDLLSYSDYLASDLKKSGHLAAYHNYAISGATIGDQHQLFLENTSAAHVIKGSDLITMTLGANDLLRVMKMLDVSFATSLSSLMNSVINGSITPENAIRQALELNKGKKAKPVD